jgi:hypothetical protein
LIEVDCSQISADEELALAAELNGALKGRAICFINHGKIVFDSLSAERLDADAVERAVRDFVARRNDAEHYSVERIDESILVRSPDPIAASHRRRIEELPPNVYKCPFCPFVTPYQELYVVHYRSHGFV